MRRILLIGAAAMAVVAGGAGLSLAQNETATPAAAPAPSFVPPPEGNAVGTSPSSSTSPGDALSPESAPDEDATTGLPDKTPEAPAPPAAGLNTVANAVDQAPAAPPPPPRRPRHPAVVLQALDKVTAETLRFEARIDEPVRYKDLVITVRACETEASDEPYTQTAAHLEVQYQPDVLGGRTAQTARQVFRGWMFADSPGLHPFEHPIYDLWVIACRTPPAAVSTPAAASPPPVPAAKGASL